MAKLFFFLADFFNFVDYKHLITNRHVQCYSCIIFSTISAINECKFIIIKCTFKKGSDVKNKMYEQKCF